MVEWLDVKNFFIEFIVNEILLDRNPEVLVNFGLGRLRPFPSALKVKD